MSSQEGKITKQDILKKIEAMLMENMDLDAQLVFDMIQPLLEPGEKIESFTTGEIGYVQIDEQRQAEYLEWEKGIKREWVETIENIRSGIIRKRNNPLAS